MRFWVSLVCVSAIRLENTVLNGVSVPQPQDHIHENPDSASTLFTWTLTDTMSFAPPFNDNRFN